MAIYVNGQPVRDCNGVHVNGGIAQKVYVNGVSAYQSKCAQYVYWSNDSIAPDTAAIGCGGATGSYQTGGFRVSGNGLQKAQWMGSAWGYGAWVWSENQGVGIGNTMIANVNYYNLNHDTITFFDLNNTTCSTSLQYSWGSNNFSGNTRSNDLKMPGGILYGDFGQSSNNMIRAAHWVGCSDCTPSSEVYGDWCAATQG